MHGLRLVIDLIGAVGLLLWGVRMVRTGMTRAFGVKLRSRLALGTRGPVRSFLAGFVATVALQSSTATALMVASFVERNLMRARMAQIVLLGANVGTAVTAWLVATGIESISPLIILVGVVFYKSSGSTARRIARERAQVPTLAMTASMKAARRLGLQWGVHAVHTRSTLNPSSPNNFRQALKPEMWS